MGVKLLRHDQARATITQERTEKNKCVTKVEVAVDDIKLAQEGVKPNDERPVVDFGHLMVDGYVGDGTLVDRMGAKFTVKTEFRQGEQGMNYHTVSIYSETPLDPKVISVGLSAPSAHEPGSRSNFDVTIDRKR